MNEHLGENLLHFQLPEYVSRYCFSIEPHTSGRGVGKKLYLQISGAPGLPLALAGYGYIVPVVNNQNAGYFNQLQSNSYNSQSYVNTGYSS